MRRASFVVTLALAIAGCSLIVDTKGLSDGATDGDAGPTDGGGDALGDATGDGSVADAAARGCAKLTDASFCQDFDDPATALTAMTWSESDVGDPKGSITLVSGEAAVSPPNAARIALTNVGGDSCQYERLSRSFPGAYTTLRARFSLRTASTGLFVAVVAAPSNLAGNTYRLLAGLSRSPGGSFTIYAFLQSHNAGVFEEVGSGEIPLEGDASLRTLDVTVEMSTSSVVLREGTAPPLTLAAPAGFALNGPRIDIGAYCRNTPATFDFDDVAAWVVR